MSNKRIEWIDVYKGMLIFLVVLGHVFQGIASDHTVTNYPGYTSILYSKWIIYSFHMPAFFLAGGFFAYCLFTKLNKLYFWHRFRRLAQPYFIWGFITAIFMQLASHFTNNGQGLRDFLYSPIRPFSIFWFLYVYLFIFIIQVILVILFNDKGNKVFLSLAVILFLVNPVIPQLWIVKSVSTYMIYYTLGLFTLSFVSKCNNLFGKRRSIVFWIIMFGMFFGIYFVYKKQGLPNNAYYLNFLTAITGSGLFICLAMFVSKFHNWFSNMNDYFGKYSMQIYVVHLLPIAGARILLLRVLHFDNLWLVTVIITIISMLSCIFVIEISRKLHLEKILFATIK